MVRKSVKKSLTEEALSVVPDSIREEHIREILKDTKSLKDVPLETKLKEAEKKLYLIRYE